MAPSTQESASFSSFQIGGQCCISIAQLWITPVPWPDLLRYHIFPFLKMAWEYEPITEWYLLSVSYERAPTVLKYSWDLFTLIHPNNQRLATCFASAGMKCPLFILFPIQFHYQDELSGIQNKKSYEKQNSTCSSEKQSWGLFMRISQFSAGVPCRVSIATGVKTNPQCIICTVICTVWRESRWQGGIKL